MFNINPFDKEFSVDTPYKNLLYKEDDDFIQKIAELIANGKKKEAIEILDSVEEDDDNYSHALLLKSGLLFDEDYEAGLDLFKKSLMAELKITDEDYFDSFMKNIEFNNDCDELFDEGLFNYEIGN